MVANKPQIVIVGAGMAGLTAAHKLYTCAAFRNQFDLCVVEGGTRIGGRINTSEFGGDRIEMGATWIHGIGGSPLHKIALDIDSLESEQPWECMDGFLEDPTTIAEGGYELNPTMVENISNVFKKLMDFAQGKLSQEEEEWYKLGATAKSRARVSGETANISLGSFLKSGLEAYWDHVGDSEEVKGYGKWSKKMIDEAVFESEYQLFPGEEITIAKGYMSIINSLAAVLPPSAVQLNHKVSRIEWVQKQEDEGNGKPVRMHFGDGSVMFADHVIITMSLGVLKDGIRPKGASLFHPPLPSNKAGAISRLGYGTVNKLFLQVNSGQECENDSKMKFPFLQMAFHRPDSDLKDNHIPWWMRRTASLSPIYKNSSVLLGWFAGDEALALETLDDDEILNGVSTTASSFLNLQSNLNSQKRSEVQFSKVLKTKWGNDPLFLGSYSYVAVGSSGDDVDKLAEPLPEISGSNDSRLPQLQILFAGEATHRTHYSTTHGAYYSGLREANRLLQHYKMVGN
uniref:Amine oxidase domain-containing protein n=1 Tax=Kalanchoe fedtschenkoi TaxID=63787 RepID=A0A7N0UYJ2_KALFE